jgi:hypothetical protein
MDIIGSVVSSLQPRPAPVDDLSMPNTSQPLIPAASRLRRACCALTLAAVASALSCAAASAATWTPVTGNTVNTEQVSTARTPDGALHVVWLRADPAQPATQDLMASTIVGNTVGAAQPVVTGWSAINQPSLLAEPDGSLRVFFGGIRSTDATDPQDGLESATAPAAGAPWTLVPGNVSVTNASYSGDVAAILGSDGTPLTTWSGTSGVRVHRGLDPAASEFDYEGALGGCCGYYSNFGLDGATGQLWLTWFSNATGKDGVWVAPVDPASGAPLGAATLMPGSQTVTGGTTNADPTLTRTSIVGRPGLPGVFIGYPGGYPTHTSALIWRVGASAPVVLAHGSGGHEHVVLAAAPGGRIWAMWSEQRGGRLVIVARRSNSQVTAWGPESSAAAPAGAQTAYALAAAAPASSLGPLDAFASFGSGGGVVTQHAVIQPAFSLVVSGKVSRRHGGKLHIATGDIVPLKGVHVTAGGHGGTTNASGLLTLTLGPTSAKHVTVTATASGYVAATASVATRR